MPTAALRPCAKAGCPALVEHGRCSVHARAQDKSRGTAQERGYDYTWSLCAKEFKAKFPLCGMRADGRLYAEHSQCVQAGVTTAAGCVDHIVPMSKGGSKYDPLNLQALCIPCNTAKGDR
jgi:5-methylcytosine-specific restriction endonuclease McrA